MDDELIDDELIDNELINDQFEVINNALEEIGIGKFQILNLIFVCLPIVFIDFSTVTYVFTARDTSYRCLVPECESAASPSAFEQPWLASALPFDHGRPAKCRRYVPTNETGRGAIRANETCHRSMFSNRTVERCVDWIYGKGDSIVKSFNIPCVDWKRTLLGTLNSAGVFVSLIYGGILSDKYGRRNTMVVLMVASGVVGMCQSFSHNYWLFVVLEFINMAIGSSSYGMAYILGIETLPPTKRLYGCATIEVINALSAAFVGVLALISPTWRYFLRYANAPLLSVSLVLFILPESLRWLYVKNERRKCVDIVKKSARVNGVFLSTNTMTELNVFSADSMGVYDPNSSLSIVTIFKSSRLLCRVLLTSLCWFSNIMVYNGLMINSVNLSSKDEDVYIDYITVALMQLPGVAIYYLILKYLPRRFGLILSFLMGALLCVCYGLVPNLGSSPRFIFYLFSMMLVNTINSLMFVYTSELFPTVFRNTSLSFCVLFGYLGGMLSPQVLLLDRINPSLPMVVYGVTLAIPALVIFRLPETKDKVLPDTLEQAEELR